MTTTQTSDLTIAAQSGTVEVKMDKRRCTIRITAEDGRESTHNLSLLAGQAPMVNTGDHVAIGEPLVADALAAPSVIRAEKRGTVSLENIEFHRGGESSVVALAAGNALDFPKINILDTADEIIDFHYVPMGARVYAFQGAKVRAGQVLAIGLPHKPDDNPLWPDDSALIAAAVQRYLKEEGVAYPSVRCCAVHGRRVEIRNNSDCLAVFYASVDDEGKISFTEE